MYNTNCEKDSLLGLFLHIQMSWQILGKLFFFARPLPLEKIDHQSQPPLVLGRGDVNNVDGGGTDSGINSDTAEEPSNVEEPDVGGEGGEEDEAPAETEAREGKQEEGELGTDRGQQERGKTRA